MVDKSKHLHLHVHDIFNNKAANQSTYMLCLWTLILRVASFQIKKGWVAGIASRHGADSIFVPVKWAKVDQNLAVAQRIASRASW
jgi:hypothetical protein